ncbi:MAG: hypothetical protein H6908_01640 [Hyphomicrobiales bacterium]|nr:hypothetical protein [Rickettsiales bacterium]MCP5361336.1 hypothetical protein [Hyphomicrobiales bacterium]
MSLILEVAGAYLILDQGVNAVAGQFDGNRVQTINAFDKEHVRGSSGSDVVRLGSGTTEVDFSKRGTLGRLGVGIVLGDALPRGNDFVFRGDMGNGGGMDLPSMPREPGWLPHNPILPPDIESADPASKISTTLIDNQSLPDTELPMMQAGVDIKMKPLQNVTIKVEGDRENWEISTGVVMIPRNMAKANAQSPQLQIISDEVGMRDNLLNNIPFMYPAIVLTNKESGRTVAFERGIQGEIVFTKGKDQSVSIEEIIKDLPNQSPEIDRDADFERKAPLRQASIDHTNTPSSRDRT